jgi:hypothetical protein
MLAVAPKEKPDRGARRKEPPGEGDASLAADMLEELGDDPPEDALRFDEHGNRLT